MTRKRSRKGLQCTAFHHEPRCTSHRPCKRRREERGTQPACECPAYGFPHRIAGGRCSDPNAQPWKRPGRRAA